MSIIRTFTIGYAVYAFMLLGAGQAGAQAVLAPDQMLSQADAIYKKGEQLATRLAGQLDDARREKDIMRANCLNRKLMETNAIIQSIGQRVKALKDADDAGNTGRMNHEFTVLSVLANKLDVVELEAAQCLGQSVFEPGAAQVVTTVPGPLPNLTPANPPLSPAPAPPPPPPPPVAPQRSGKPFPLEYSLDNYISGNNLDPAGVTWEVSAGSDAVVVSYDAGERKATISKGASWATGGSVAVTFKANFTNGTSTTHVMTVKTGAEK